jgi:V/A-type H+/Na+-transporting ATPase subunit E
MKEKIENLDRIILKLKEQGIKAGETEKDMIIEKANEDAKRIAGDAEALSRQIIEKAKADAAQMEKNAKAAIQQASRDLIEATKIEIIKQLKTAFGKHCESLLTQEQYLQELLKAVTGALPGGKQVELPAPMVQKMESFLLKNALSEGIEIKPLPQSETKIVVTCTEQAGVQYVVTAKDIENAMFSLINTDLVERLTKPTEE